MEFRERADLKNMYKTKLEGSFPESIEILGKKLVKVEDLRYGTNPHQPAAYYRPADGSNLFLGAYRILKTGKSGLSQTNLEDLHHAYGILKYFSQPACAVMKHCNPSGVAVRRDGQRLVDVYRRARDADAQAAFGGVVAFNVELDAETADEIMQTVIEGVSAPSFSNEALEILNSYDKYKRNKELRVIQVPSMDSLPKYIGDEINCFEIKVFDDGSVVLAQPYLTKIKTVKDFVPAYAEHPKKGKIECVKYPSQRELEDLLFAWYVNIHVRSNGVVIAKNGQTLAVGTGQQDRVGAVEQAIEKAKRKYSGEESLDGAVLASDGFFPFPDAVEAGLNVGITAFVQPGGSVNDYDVIETVNKAGASMVFTGERCFSHH
ncbi:MAG: IMP cyclohydrolase [Candidatus Hydrogenedentes bacterium]|nr:IMP cyclohydrolase [Candidatus Hydrogenedentota bacterium]